MNASLDKSIHSASWVICPKEFAAPTVRRALKVNGAKKAQIAVSALGFYHVYVNGTRVNNEFFRPSNSMFRYRDPANWKFQLQDSFTYRCYYAIYDITPYLKDGENNIGIALGDGWYRQTYRRAEGCMEFGDALGTIYAIDLEDSDGKRTLLSDGTESCYVGPLTESQLFYGETYDARLEPEECWTWAKVEITELPETMLTPEDAPADRIIRKIKPTLISETPERKIYDTLENISGFITLRTSAAPGEEVHVRFAELLDDDGELFFGSTGYGYTAPDGRHQIMEEVFIGDGKEHLFTPSFVWHAFKYFEITGDGEPEEVLVVHSDTPPIADFRCSDPEINWLFDAFRRTQLNNMHSGVPSDCPHRERLGYTGDGQITSPSAMIMLDSKNFYLKWARDIFDCQDPNTGHVNHTAPYAGGGGGPGGWGCSAIIIPHNYYRIYGDLSLAKEYYDRMKKWVGYLLDHSDDGLVTREEEGGWCLGDWLTLEKIEIPKHYVNTCYFIKSLRMMEEFAALLGHDEDIPAFRQYRETAEAAVKKNWYDPETGSFAGGIQGADAYAIWAGIDDERTLKALTDKYRALGHFDTGFLCTDILCEVLIEKGEAELLHTLLTSHERGSFGYMMDSGSTTLFEHWRGGRDHLTHNHPMFGSCARQLLLGFLGIRQENGTAGYSNIVIEPQLPKGMQFAEGYQTISQGKIEVRWEKKDGEVQFRIVIPENCPATFKFGGETVALPAGETLRTVAI